jgi:hypothetical protein
MSAITTLAALAEPWANVYNDTPMLQSAVTFVHLAGLLLGGGFAIATDMATLRGARAPELERARFVADLHAAHRPVLIGLAATFASGLLMLGGDVEELLGAPVFWIKMALLALLLANGAVMQRTESRLRDARLEPAVGWRRLHRTAIASFALWFATLLAGTLLLNAG